MSEICIKEYENDIKSGCRYYCGLLMEDFGDKQKAFEYAKEHTVWEDVAHHIIYNPDQSNEHAELYFAITEAAKNIFKTTLLGTY